MTDHEFEQLKRKIYWKMQELRKLQKEHRIETGTEFVISRPLPKPDEDEPPRSGSFIPVYPYKHPLED